MRVSYFFVILVSLMILVTAKPFLQDRLSPTKSTTVSQNYILLKPVSAALSYIYLTKRALSSASSHVTSNDDDHHHLSTIHHLPQQQQQQQEILTDRTKNSMIIKSSSSAVDTNHHNGPVTALALVLFFCVLSF